MARTVLPFIGAAVGFWIGGPTGAQVGFALGGVVGNAVDPVKNVGPRIGETGAQTSAEGAPRAIVYGVAPVTGNVIVAGALIKGDFEEGGKGGPVNVTERCFRTYAIRICEGPIAGVLRIWENDKLVADFRPESSIVEATEKWMFGCGIYLGDETQMPDGFLTINTYEDNPAYRGTAYMVFVFRDLTDFRGAIPQYRFEVAQSAQTVSLPRIDSYDSNSGVIVMGGGGGSSANLFFETISAPENFSTVYPLMRFQGGYPPEASNPRTNSASRIQVIQDGTGTMIYDTGWLGDVADQAALDAMLIDTGHADLIGPIGTDGDYITHEIHGINQTARIYGYAAAFPPSGTAYFAVQARLTWPDPALAPEGYTFHPTVDGVGVAPDGSMFAASWGPDDVSVTGGPVLLSSIVADIHARCQVEAFDVSELVQEVGGLVLAGEYTGADAINTLRGPYFFDKAEYDNKLWYPKRGAAVVDTLTIDDLIDEPDTQMREQALEYPRKFHLFYQHAGSGYAVVKATSQRSSPNVQVVGEVTAQVPVVFANAEDEAAQAAAKMHKVSWAEAEGEVKFSIPWSFLRFIPSNNIGLSLRGRVNRLRFTHLDLHDGVIDVTARHDRQSAYTSNVTGIPIPNPTPPPDTIVGDTDLVVLDIPSLRDTEDDLNIYYGVTGAQPGWYGAVVQRSTDGGSTWTNISQINTASVIGELTVALPDADEDYTDTTNNVHVRLYRAGQSLESISETAFLSEGGAFALENVDGTWEILQALDWSEDSSGEWVGSTLHRGRLNTTTNSHAIGRRFVMLDGLTHVQTQSSMIGQSVMHRAPSLSQSPELAATQTMTYTGASQIEWPPASLVLARDGSDVITGSWAPRYRFGTDDAPVNSINMIGYRITIVGTSTVTFDQTSNLLDFDASGLGASVVVSVQTLNRITGAGPATSGTV